MTKEEKIKEAYGEYYEYFRPYLQENGELALSNIDSELWEIVDELDFVSIGNGHSTLKSLQGIKNNNGWILIEKESDLPTNENNLYHYYDVRVKNRMLALNVQLGNFSFEEIKRLYRGGICTHYREKVTIEPPIF